MLADRVEHLARARRRAAGDDRARAAAGGPVRRTGDRNGRLAAEPGAVARRDPSGRDARRPGRSRPVRRRAPVDRVPALLERVNLQTLHAGPKECLDSAGQLASELSAKLGRRVSPGVPRDKRDRWGRLRGVADRLHGQRRHAHVELRLRVVTFPTRDFTQRRLGARRMSEKYNAQASAAMDLGEAVQTAVERGLPLLLSTEAAGHLKDKIRVGRMKGRPGALTITTSDGLSATTRRLVAEQAIPELRALKCAGSEGDARRRRPADGADDRRPAAGRRPGAARPPAGDRRAEGGRLRRRRVANRRREDHQLGPGARRTEPRRPAVPGDGRRRGQATRAVARRAQPRRARPRTAAAGAEPRAAGARRPAPGRRSDARVRPRAGRPARRGAVRPTARSTATRPTCRRSAGIC